MSVYKSMDDWENPAVLDATQEDRDLPLVRRFVAGDKRAFDELLARYQPYVYNICLQMLANPSDAEDAAQNVFVGICKALPRFQMRSKVSTWIYRITVNRCISYRRNRHTAMPAEGDLGDRSPSAADLEKRRTVRCLLQKLPAHYRAVLVLKYYRQLSYEEIAEILGWSPAKVKCYLHRARNVFKQAYECENLDGGNP